MSFCLVLKSVTLNNLERRSGWQLPGFGLPSAMIIGQSVRFSV